MQARLELLTLVSGKILLQFSPMYFCLELENLGLQNY